MNAQALTWTQYRRKRWLLRDYLKLACKHNNGTLKPKNIEKAIKAGLEIPILFMDGKLIIGMVTLQLQKDAVFVTTIAGRFEKGWQNDVFALLKSIAGSQDRERIRLRGRPGWSRLLKPLGFYTVDNFLEVAL